MTGPPDARHRQGVREHCAAAERCNPPPENEARTWSNPSSADRHRTAAYRTRNCCPGSAIPPSDDPSGVAASGPTGRPRPRTAPTGRCGPTAPNHRHSPPGTTARSGPWRPGRVAATRAHPTRPTGPRRARTTDRAPPAAPTDVPRDRPPDGSTTPLPRVGCAASAGSPPDGTPSRPSLPPDLHRTRSPGDDRPAHDGDDGRRPRRKPAPPLSRRADGPRTPDPGDGRASTPGCGPNRGPRRSPAVHADRSRRPVACRSPRHHASRHRNSGAQARPRHRPHRARHAGHHRQPVEPPTPAPIAAGRRRPVRPAHDPAHAAGWRCGSPRPRRRGRPERAAQADPTRRLADARAGCPPRVPSPGNSRPECDPSEPKA